jgi:hypothetical protein
MTAENRGNEIVPWRCEECGAAFETEDGGRCTQCGGILCRKHMFGWRVLEREAAGSRGPICLECRGATSEQSGQRR